MQTAAHRIAGIAAQARAGELDQADAIAGIADVAQQRGGRSGRRSDGAFFTDQDVASWLARRAVFARLLDAAGIPSSEVDRLLADGADLAAALAARCGDHEAHAAALATVRSMRILDPTCGAGAFLVAAWQELVVAAELLGKPGGPDPAQLHGVDIDADAIAACRATLELVIGPTAAAAHLVVADAERAGTLPAADVVVGNPPFVRATASAVHADLDAARVPNRSAWVVERALKAAAPRARTGFVLPIATACTDGYAAARHAWAACCDVVHAAHFDTIPASLFQGVVQRVSLFEGRVRAGSDDPSCCDWWSTRYYRWTRDERAGLLDRVRHVRVAHPDPAASLPKVGTPLEVALLDRIRAFPPAGRWFAAQGSAPNNRIRYKRRWSYFLLFTDFTPGIWEADGTPRQPTEFKSIDVRPELDARVLLAVYSSTLFWWYFSVFTDNRNVNRRDLAAFALPDLDDRAVAHLAALGHELMLELQASSEVRTCTYRSIGTIRNTYFRQGATRPVLDRIDAELARAYGLDEEQLEFILGFERRFRGGVPG